MIALYAYEDFDDQELTIELRRRKQYQSDEEIYIVPDEDLLPDDMVAVPIVDDDPFKDEITVPNSDVRSFLFTQLGRSMTPPEVKAWREIASRQLRPEGRYRFKSNR